MIFCTASVLHEDGKTCLYRVLRHGQVFQFA